jgi:hypothetical protein
MSTSQPSTPSAPESSRELAFDKLIAGRLALQVLRGALHQQDATLRAQLAQNFEHEQRIDHMLERLDRRLAEHHPAAWKILTGE